MDLTTPSKLWLAALSLVALGACAGSEATQGSPAQPHLEDSAQTPDGSGDEDFGPITGASGNGMAFTHKMMKRTGENAFATLAYECPACTFEQWLAINPPNGWTKGPAQVLVASGGELRSLPSLEGVPSTMDFIEEIPGNEYQMIAKNLDGRLIQADAVELVVEAQVMRDTLLYFDAGRRVHELTDPDGRVFVLFAYEVDPENVVIPDFDAPDFLVDFTPPEGWAIGTRVLDEQLQLDSPNVATVLAIRGNISSTWELR